MRGRRVVDAIIVPHFVTADLQAPVWALAALALSMIVAAICTIENDYLPSLSWAIACLS